jgi:outer membrane protein assembly factor BamD
MTYRVRFLLVFALACVAFPVRSPAPVVFRPGENAKYEGPGDEEVNGDASQLFNIGQSAERDGNRGRAIKAYRKLIHRFPHSELASGAEFNLARLLEANGNKLRAAAAYRELVEKYPRTNHFDEAIEAQFQIGEMYLSGKKVKVLGVPLATSMTDAVEIFAGIVKNAPYGRYTVRAQFDIGRAREKQGSNDLAIDAYRAVVEKFPNDPLAADAQYQIGYIWFKAARAGTYDQNAAKEARNGFQDFLFRYPKSEKAAQARENLRLLGQKQISNAFDIAKYYDKQKNYRAAVIYYNEVIRQQPGSGQGEASKKRLDELRAKVGDAALQPASVPRTPKTKPGSPPGLEAAGHADAPTGPIQRPPDKPAMRGNASDLAPLPPPGADTALPPPASLSPEPSAPPEATASPSP